MAGSSDPRSPKATLLPASTIFAPRVVLAKSGVRLRVATFEGPPEFSSRRAIVLLHGQTEFIEKYFEVVDELRGRGFAVATIDWRGHGASQRSLRESAKVHIEDFSEYDEDLATLLDEVVRPLSNCTPIALAHSMGGHILLRTLHARPKTFACAVLSAPMIAVATPGYPSFVARAVTGVMKLRGRSSDWVWGMDKLDPRTTAFADQRVTSDPNRFARTQKLLVGAPDLRLAGPTWGWLEAAFQSMRAMQGAGFAETISTPTLFCGAGRDRVVLTDAIRALARRMPNARYVEFEDSEHEILMENDAIRARFWKAFDEFVAPYANGE